MNVTYKVFSSLILERLLEVVEHNTGVNEKQFRQNRYTMENIQNKTNL